MVCPQLNDVYYNYRYYSPELGRWLSRDPIAIVGSTAWWDDNPERVKLQELVHYIENKIASVFSLSALNHIDISQQIQLLNEVLLSLQYEFNMDLLGKRDNNNNDNPYNHTGNNPVTYIDKDGKIWWVVIGAVVGGVVGGISAAATGGNVAAGILGGAVGGAVTAATGNPALGGAVSSAITTVASQYAAGQNVTSASSLIHTAVNTAIGTGIGYAGGQIASQIANVSGGVAPAANSGISTTTANLINDTVSGLAAGTTNAIVDATANLVNNVIPSTGRALRSRQCTPCQ